MNYLILIIITLIALIVIFIILWRKIPKIKKENIEVTLKDKQIEVKKKLIESRLEKRILKIGLFITDKIKLFFDMSSLGFRRIKKKGYQTFKNNNFISRSKNKAKNQLVVNSKNNLSDLILEAQTLLRKRKINAAEDKFIKVLEINPKNIEAYMGLGKIYVVRKDLVTAEEAYRYIIKIDNKFLNGYKELSHVFELTKKWDDLKKMAEEVLALGHEKAWVYSILAVSYRKRGYPEEAETYFRKAVEIEPQNELWLDQLIETAILNKNKVLAQRAFNTLSQICLDGIKLQSYRDKMDLL